MLKQLIAPAVLLAVTTTGCSSMKSDTETVADLPKIEPTLAVIDPWKHGVGKGLSQRYLSVYPRLYDGVIYATDEEGDVIALDAESGKRIWKASVDVPVTAGVGGGDRVVAVGSQEGEVIALEPESGEELWRKQLSSEVVAIADSTALIVAVRTQDGKLTGLDPTSGEQLWQQARKTPVLSLKGSSRPVVSGSKVIVGMDNGKLLGVSAGRGKLLWETTISTPSGRSELERMVDIDGDIVIIDGIAYAASFQGEVVAVAVSDGRILWTRDFSTFLGLDGDQERIYGTDDEGSVWAFDRRTGGALWKQDKLKTRRITRPSAAYPFVLVADGFGYIHWLDGEAGHFVARQRVGSDPLVSAPIVVGTRAYAQSSSGKLAALEFVPEL